MQQAKRHKTYRADVRTDSDYDQIPAVATFDIGEQTAKEIIRLSGLVKENKLYKVDKFDYRADFLMDDAEDGADDAVNVSTDADRLNVSETEFWFSAEIKHTNVEIVTVRQSIAELAAHFGLPIDGVEHKPFAKSETAEVFEGYLSHAGMRIEASFQAPVGASVEMKDAAFMAALAQQAELNYLSVGTTEPGRPAG